MHTRARRVSANAPPPTMVLRLISPYLMSYMRQNGTTNLVRQARREKGGQFNGAGGDRRLRMGGSTRREPAPLPRISPGLPNLSLNFCRTICYSPLRLPGREPIYRALRKELHHGQHQAGADQCFGQNRCDRHGQGPGSPRRGDSFYGRHGQSVARCRRQSHRCGGLYGLPGNT